MNLKSECHGPRNARTSRLDSSACSLILLLSSRHGETKVVGDASVLAASSISSPAACIIGAKFVFAFGLTRPGAVSVRLLGREIDETVGAPSYDTTLPAFWNAKGLESDCHRLPIHTSHPKLLVFSAVLVLSPRHRVI